MGTIPRVIFHETVQVPADQASKKGNADTVEVPLYYDNLREEQVTSISIPCSGSPSVWKLKSVALLLKNQ